MEKVVQRAPKYGVAASLGSQRLFRPDDLYWKKRMVPLTRDLLSSLFWVSIPLQPLAEHVVHTSLLLRS